MNRAYHFNLYVNGTCSSRPDITEILLKVALNNINQPTIKGTFSCSLECPVYTGLTAVL
jgi:hypothetical protein